MSVCAIQRRLRQLSLLVPVLFGVSVADVSGQEATAEKVLFDGKTLDGWDGDPRFWRVEDGAIVGETTADNKAEQNTFLIYRGGEFGNFDMSFEYQVKGFNSGVQYRSEEIGEWSIGGYQCDFEDRWHSTDSGKVDKFSGMFFDEKGRMFMGQRGDAVVVRTNSENGKKPLIEKIGTVGDPVQLEKAIHRDGWNRCRVIANDFQFVHIINDRVMSIGIDEDTEHRKSSGLIAFQLHSGPPMQIRIRNLKVRELAND
ncbi:3-keto-disaccharide hydrolase [Thalassoglobus neptunius]|nr:DUF1080 domain-containing protein [Thalassoglobus neptunius]